MAKQRAWAAYPANYRAREIAIMASWILAGESGSVVGMTGSGKSNLLGFICNRPEVLDPYLPDHKLNVALVQVDLNDLPDSDLGTFYRALLRSLFEARPQLADLEPGLATAVEVLYRKVEDNPDAFFSQSALREALFLFQEEQLRLVLVLDPFDEFCRTAPLQLLDNLRGLRDSFKTVLSYIVGVGYELAYLRDPMEMGKLYKLLDEHICWLGAMDERDARWVISQVEAATRRVFTEAEIDRLIEITGGYPSLLRMASLWLARVSPVPDKAKWGEILLAERSLQHRLESLWNGLTVEEQLALSELQKLQSQLSKEKGEVRPETPGKSAALDKAFQGLSEQHRDVLNALTAKGFCQPLGKYRRIQNELLASYIASVEGRGSGKIWLDEEADVIYFGRTPLEDLAPLEQSVLSFLIKHPRVRHTKTDLIINTWPDELRREGVTDQSLYQVILELRKKIEPNWTKPSYLVTWRGKPEGGYQFFPEGKPL
jgi:hypothetical protein